MKTLLLWLSTAALLVGVLIPTSAPAQYTIVNVIPTDQSAEADENAEPSIAVNPNDNRQTIVATFSTPGNFIKQPPVFVCADPVSANPATKWKLLETIPHGDQTYDWTSGGTAYGSFLLFPNANNPRDISVSSSANPVGGNRFNIGGTVNLRNSILSDAKNGLDQPWVVTQRRGLSDRIYVSFNSIATGGTYPNSAYTYFSLDSGSTWSAPAKLDPAPGVPFIQDSPSARVAVSGDRVYVAFERWLDDTKGTGLPGKAVPPGKPESDRVAKVLVVRDDNAGRGNGGTAFQVLGVNPLNVTAAYPGGRISVPNTRIDNSGTSLGHEREGSEVSIAIDPRNPDQLYIAWVQLDPPNGAPVSKVHVAYSTDGATNWQEVYKVSINSGLPALTVATNGTVGLLYTAFNTNNLNLETHFVQASSGFNPVFSDDTLSTFPDNNPVQVGSPYIGDYQNVRAVGGTFYGTFCASGDPRPNNFPSAQPMFQRWIRNSITGLTNSTLLPLNGVNKLVDTNGASVSNKWVQIPDTTTNGLDVLNDGFLLADDFLCTTSGPITQIKIWGSWNSNLVAAAPTFILAILSDKPAAGGNPSEPAVDPSNPGANGSDLLWARSFPVGTYTTNVYAAGVNELFYDPRTAGTNGIIGTDSQIWEYTFNISGAFVQTNGSTYWLIVRVDNTDTNRFGWKTCPTNWNDTAVFNELDKTGWKPFERPGTTNGVGFAFALGMGPVPSIDPYYFSTPIKTNQNTTWSQPPGYLVYPTNGLSRGVDRESDIYMGYQSSQKVVADDFVYKGAQVRRVRWWGSYLNGNDYPAEDGYILSFFKDQPAGGGNPSSPVDLLATYLAPVQAVRVCYSGYSGCDGLPIYQYELDLKDACTNFINANTNGNAAGFLGVSNAVYWLSIAAYAGATLNPATCLLVTNGNARTVGTNFWGWHTSPIQNNDVSVTGNLLAATSPLVYGPWGTNAAVCSTQEIDQAFILYNDLGNVAPPISFDTNSLPNMKWLQRPNLSPFGMDVLATDGSPAPIVADDFRCTQSGALYRFHVWGSWLNDRFDPSAKFRLALWQDTPATTNSLSHPGARLWLKTFTNGPAGAPFSYSVSVEAAGACERFYDPAHPAFAGMDTTVYRYDFYVPTNQAFYQVSNTVYWLSLNAVTTNAFGWKTALTNDHNLDAAVWSSLNSPGAGDWTGLFYPSNHLYRPAAVDLSFAVASVFVPPPPPPVTNILVVGKWLQIPDTSPNGLDVRATLPKILADDFLCNTSGPITKIEIWGSWLNDINDATPQFCLGIWSDVPAAGGVHSHPGVQLWGGCFYHGQYSYEDPYPPGFEQFYDPNLGTNLNAIIGTDTVIWHYTFPVALTNAFRQTNGTVYWLSVAAQVSDANEFLFGWKTCPTNWNDDAVFNDLDNFNNLTGPWQELIRPGTTNSLDLAFALSTTRITTNTPPPPPPPYIPTNYLVQWSQTPAYLRTSIPSGGDSPSDFVWGSLGPNPVTADDWQADGRPILGLRWWGSYLNGYGTNVVDGFVLSFFSNGHPVSEADGGPGDMAAEGGGVGQPIELLGTYVVPRSAVKVTDTGAQGADGAEIYRYEASLSDACLINAGAEALPGSFEAVSNQTYWLSIQAEAGMSFFHTTDFYGADACNSTITTNQPSADFWGWHTAPCEQLSPSASGLFDNFGLDWQYYDWLNNGLFYGEIDQAFETLVDSTIAPPAPTSTSLTGLTWLQRPDLTPQGLAMLATTNRNVTLVADDFVLANGLPLTSLKFWGSWLDDQIDAGAVVLLRIWSNAPAATLPGAPLWQANFTNIFNYQVFPETPTVCGEPFFDPTTNSSVGVDSQVYRYECFAPTAQAFIPAPGAVYWLSVTMINTTNRFGWKTAAPYDHFNASAAWKVSFPDPLWFPLAYPASHPYAARATNTLDMAFALTTGCANAAPPIIASTLQDDGQVLISWPDTGDCFYVLQSTPTLDPPITWTAVPLTTPNSFVVRPTNSAMFFRLCKP